MNEEDTYKVPVLFEKFKEEFRNLVAVCANLWIAYLERCTLISSLGAD